MNPRLAAVSSLGTSAPRRTVPVAEVQGTLALDLGIGGTRGATRTEAPDPLEFDAAARSRLPSISDGDLRPWAARFAQAVVETLGGDRPASQLVRWTSRQVQADLERRAQVVLAVRNGRGGRPVRAQVRTVHVFQPSPVVAEISVHVRHGERSRALAARLERRADRWVCTALELG